eukprot:TRINITY_DN1987_c0_g1_i1.p1 TRINITY_DN1987_c0_g1~~TRINITY_DN1987_c0_g1_i1.p1  ORF type:complete len:503 (-),score=172.69 TRINITY_DN1987_c0_g1_i1:378-1886(-)
MSSTNRASVKKLTSGSSQRRASKNIQIRKNKRIQNLQRRRAPTAGLPQAPKVEMNFTSFEEARVALASTDDITCRNGIYHVRKMLAQRRDPPVNEVISAGLLPGMVKLLLHPNPDIQFEALWAITNVASSEFTSEVYDLDAVPVLIGLLSHHDINVRNQASWCLGNIAGDNVTYGHNVLLKGGFEPLMKNVVTFEEGSHDLQGNAAWTILNLCRSRPPAEHMRFMLPLLVEMMGVDHDDVKYDICWALSYCASSQDEIIKFALECNVHTGMLSILDTEVQGRVLIPAMRTIGNILSGNSPHLTQSILDLDGLDYIARWLSTDSTTLQKEAVWCLSNIAAGTESQIQRLVDRADILEYILKIAMGPEKPVRVEAAHTIANVFYCGAERHVIQMANGGCLPPLAAQLKSPNAHLVKSCLQAIQAVLNVSQTMESNPYYRILEEAEAFEQIVELQNHPTTEISDLSSKILEDFCNCEYDEEGADNVGEGGTYNFGSEAAGGQYSF